MDSPLFSPCFFGKSPCPAWTLPDRGFPCYRFPHAGDRASKSQVFLFFRIERRNQDDNFQQHSSNQHNTEAIGCEPHPDGCRPNHPSFSLNSDFVDFTLLGCGDCLVPVAGVEPARISIRSPHARGDVLVRSDFKRRIISIHSPHARGDNGAVCKLMITGLFQSTPLMRGETCWLFRYRWGLNDFNPLPSCEGRRRRCPAPSRSAKFQSTPLMRGETWTGQICGIDV